MKKLTPILATMGIALVFGGTILPAAGDSNVVTASAATKQSNIQRDTIWAFKQHDYKVVNTKGKTYQMTGKASNIKLTANHYLKNYKKSTWVRHKATQIKQNGNWNMYYYVTTGKKGKINGWVKVNDVDLKHHNKPKKHVQGDFDTYYHKLNQAQRNDYVETIQYGGCRTATGEPIQV
ncbi:hypothetical protein [Lactiplantibacillus daowaiensis]|uniref:Extracellular protein n=1 Tax=Lactiplantibacillus daowaiensis TaxID=2559918 RepID=A0ABW1RZP2_9LACO|nr:hypothetical protein [Lactiplantibacillus daowaiensis]